ncbi:SPFH domain-containing protein [Streptomyces sp. NPDC039016]|uniref:SPFH domain-containing protein n=1 Tax=Streptomyces sp. NPDC039016 TaxID=3154330 RepID=UPI00340E2949
MDPTLHENRAVALPGWVALMILLAGTVTMVAILGSTGRIPYWDALPDIRSHAVRAGNPGAPTAGMLAAFVVASLLVLLSVTGLLINSSGQARILTRWGRYRGTVRRTGLLWVNPLLRRRRVDVGLRHWRSENVDVVDRTGLPIVVKLLLVWRVKDTARAHFTVADHESYLREQVHAALTRTASALPCDSNGVPGPALRDGDWFGDELTRWLAPQVAPVGLEVFSVQPLALDYAPEVAESMRRRQLADLEASLRTVVLDDAIETATLAVQRLEHTTAQELDSTARNALMEHLLVAFLAPTAAVRTGASFGTRTGSYPPIAGPTKAATSSVPASAGRPENEER